MIGKFTVHELSAAHGNNKWRVEGKINGQRIRAFFATKLAAEENARLKNIDLADHGHKHAHIPDALRAETLRCQSRLDPIGASLSDAVDFYLAHHELRNASVTVTEAANRLDADNARKVAAYELTNKAANSYRSAINRFAFEFGERYICEIEGLQITEWLNRQAVRTATRNSMRRHVGRLFYYAEECGWLKTNPIPKVKSARAKAGELPGILSIDEMAKLLGTAPESLVPKLAIGLFAGIRPTEIQRLRWENINWHRRQIDMIAKITKTAQSRWVDMSDNLIEWLTPYRKANGWIIQTRDQNKVSADITAAAKAAGIDPWPNDGCRHSFGSYHLAAYENAAVTAKQMGHMSTDMLYKHYNNRRTKEEGIAFFNIRPASEPQNIVAMA